MKDIAINTILKQIPITAVILHTHVGLSMPVSVVVPSLGEGSCLCLQSVEAASASPHKQGQSQDQDLSAGPRTDPSLSLMQYSGVQESCASLCQTEIIKNQGCHLASPHPRHKASWGSALSPAAHAYPRGWASPAAASWTTELCWQQGRVLLLPTRAAWQSQALLKPST